MSILDKLLKLSLHPKLTAGLDLLAGFGLVFWLSKISAFAWLSAWLAARVLISALFAAVTFSPQGVRRVDTFLSHFVFGTGMVFLLAVLEKGALWTGAAFGTAFLPAASWWLLPQQKNVLSFSLKPLRRWRLIMTIAALFGWWSGWFAAFTFQVYPVFTFWVLLIGAAGSALLAAWWWRIYDVPRERRYWVSLLALGLIILELAVSLAFWPLGYLVTGFIITWFWCVLWLILRFYCLPEGINWRRQTGFLVINAVLMAVYLFFIVRWH